MPLSEQQKTEVVERAVEILRSPDRQARMDALRDKVMSADPPPDGAAFDLDDALYSVLQALAEIYD